MIPHVKYFESRKNQKIETEKPQSNQIIEATDNINITDTIKVINKPRVKKFNRMFRENSDENRRIKEDEPEIK